jgi:hypothetical protein
MKGTFRLLAVSAIALGALALAAPALAAYGSPRLRIMNPDEKTSGGGRVTIHFEAAREDDATFRFQIYVPDGYTTSLVPQAAQNLGTVAAVINATAISPDALVPVTGNIIGDTYDTAKYPQGAGCVGDPAIDGVWRLELAAAGQTLIVPMYVQAIDSGPLAEFASGRLTACLPSPYPEAGPARASLGAKLVSATLNVRGVFTNPTARGAYRWRALATPWTVNSGVPNPAGTVEVQAFDAIPVNLTMAAAVNHRLNRVTLSGRLTENLAAQPGRIVEILRGARVLRRVRTNARGNFRAVLRLRPGRYTLRAQAQKAGFNLGAGGCTVTTAFGGVPCISATSSSFSVFVNRRVVVRVR